MSQEDEALDSYCREITLAVYRSFYDYIQWQDDSSTQVLTDFERNMDLSVQYLRQDHFEDAVAMDDRMREVQPLGLTSDGALKVIRRYFPHGKRIALKFQSLCRCGRALLDRRSH